jgi:hypothetical protein
MKIYGIVSSQQNQHKTLNFIGKEAYVSTVSKNTARLPSSFGLPDQQISSMATSKLQPKSWRSATMLFGCDFPPDQTDCVIHGCQSKYRREKEVGGKPQGSPLPSLVCPAPSFSLSLLSPFCLVFKADIK